ncbi:tetratricopeptide repeat-containing sensor histidine kinase [Formosa algae]|uniref:Signal transduction histidine kinase n=1 Tax=Formosa algae TaxID=225843 RepID=A0A9X1CB31_9FLAO|nr:ATP-binding protein [Formosa algae]MBP1838714.1 signal transduction histidine kinase [Formosa algae]MDQ0335214.1 signal transduction histidine kinase [Formosa algae]
MNVLINRNLFLGVFILIFVFPMHTVFGFQNTEIDSLSYYNKLISNLNNETNLAKAYVFFDKMKTESIAEKDTSYVVYYTQKISMIQYSLGDYYGSENSAVVALSWLSHSDSEFAKTNKIGLYNRLGKIYNELLDYDLAIKYYNKSLKLATAQEHINIIENNRALIYIKQNKLELAEQEFVKIYNNSKQLTDTIQIYRVLDNLGFVQSKLNKPEGLENMLKALRLKLAINHSSSLYASYAHLFEYYKDRSDFKTARVYGKKAYVLAKQINSPSFIENALINLLSIESNPYINHYLTLTDSLKTAKLLQENKYSKAKYDYTETENQANENLLKREREKRWKLTYLSIGIFIALMSVFVFVFQRYKYKKEKQFEIYNTKTRISKKIHDEVANDIHSVLNKLQEQPHVTEDILDDLDGIYARTRDISKENNTLDVDSNFEELLNDLLLAYKSNRVNVIKQSAPEIDWNNMKTYKKVAIYRVIQELLVNMKKHSEASIVVLKFSKINKKIEIFYSDNGLGCKLKKGFGIHNTENRINTIKGTITFETEPGKGFKAKIVI